MDVTPFSLEGPLLIKPKLFTDDRGCFSESYHKARYFQAGILVDFVQDNFVVSHQHVLRGLHYQESHGQAKLISVVSGKIADVAVDIRKDSPTFGKWIMQELSEDNSYQLFIPVGFAHGYYVLSKKAIVLYKVSSFYDPREEKTLRWNDPLFNITWPTQTPILSQRDSL